MNYRRVQRALAVATLWSVLCVSAEVHSADATPEVDVQNDEMDVTLFRGAANNTYFQVYFNAAPIDGAEHVEMRSKTISLRPERGVSLHVEIYNPKASIPLIVTPGGNGDTRGFGGFARNLAASAPELQVIIYDRRNLGQSEVNFGSEPQMVEEGEDLHVLIDRLEVAPVALYGMSSGGRSNMYLASRYPDDVAALILAPLTGGPLAAQRLSEEYFLKYLHNHKLATMTHISEAPLLSMKDVARTPLWSAYLERNNRKKRRRFYNTDIADFLAAMKTSALHLRGTGAQTALGMTDDALAALEISETLILHHGSYTDYLHPMTNSRAALSLIPNSTLVIAPYLPEILEALVPFVKKNASK